MKNIISNNFGKYLLAGVMAAGVASVALPTFAGVPSDTIDLTSTVAVDCSITVSNKNGSLDIVAGESDKKVADIVEHCNETAGYTISFASQNGGDLDGTGALAGNPGASVDYTMSYDTSSGADLATDLGLTRGDAEFNKAHGLFVSVSASDERLAGSYEDTITVTIAAN